MPVYLYKAKDGPGRVVTGTLKEDSRPAVIARLGAMGYSPVSIEEQAAGASVAPGRWRLARRPGKRDVTVFTRQLASLLKAGVPILRSLATIREQSENPVFARVVDDLEARIQDGGMLSDALERHPRLFSSLYVNMIKAGEWGGVLDGVLSRLAVVREEEEETRRKVQAAVAYPVLILTVGLITVFVLLAFFLPRVLALFQNVQALPLPTRILMGISRFFSETWPWLLAALAVLALTARRLLRIEKGQLRFDRFKLRIPVLRHFIVYAELSRFCRTLALLLNAGVNIDKALELSMATVQNRVLRQDLDQARRDTIQQGLPFSGGLRRSVWIPVYVGNMAVVGEEGGHLDEALQEVSSFYEKELDLRMRLMTSLLEPLLILGIGVLVGFIVAAMLLPIFNLSSTLR
jgi:type II secretory pathway component PulF